MRINTFCLSLTTALLCACGSNVGHMNDVISHKRVNVRYPSEDYFTAIGYSDNGKIGEAIEDAKARVARSISSNISAQSRIDKSSMVKTRNDEVLTSSEVSYISEAEFSSQFDRGELIRQAPDLSRCVLSQCTAAVYLEKSQLAESIMVDYRPLSASYLQLSDRCVNQATREEIVGFSECLSQSATQFTKLKVMGATLALLNQPPAAQQRIQGQQLKLLKLRGQLAAKAPVLIDISEFEDQELAEPFAVAYRNYLAALGAETRPFYGGGEACANQPTAAVHFKLTRGSTKSGLMGRVKSFSLILEGTSCQSKRMIAKARIKFSYAHLDNKSPTESVTQSLEEDATQTIAELYKLLSNTIPLTAP